MRGNVIRMSVADGILGTGDKLHQYDYGQRIEFDGVELPFAYEVHFGNAPNDNAKTSIGDASGVDIPDEFLLSGKDLYVWVYLHSGEADGETEYRGVIPVIKRAKPTNQEPTPVQQDTITQAIAALDAAVAQTGQDVIDTDAAKEAAQEAKRKAETAQGKAEEAQREAETAQQKAEEAKGGAKAAQELAETAQQKAEEARDEATRQAGIAKGQADRSEQQADRAEQAANTAGYMWIEMDENGHLRYTRTDAVDVDFELEDGHLMMEVI